MIITRFTSILFLCFFCGHSYAESWTNYIRNYKQSDYDGGSQNWQIIEHNDWVYVANKRGLLEFHANGWQLYPLKNGSDVRAICMSSDNKKIFVGGSDEFGYMHPNKIGKLEYICLSDSLKQSQLNFGSIWNISKIGKTIYFVAENLIIEYNEKGCRTMTSPQKIDRSAVINDTFYIATKMGIYIVNKDAFVLVPQSKLLKNKKITAMIPYEGNALIATLSNGLFILTKGKLVPFTTKADIEFKNNSIFSLASSERYVAVGTILGGVILLDHRGNIIKYVNENNGLQNNTVLSLSFDRQGNLWQGLDNGLDYSILNSPITTLFTYHNFYGAGYDADFYQGKLYLATNRGLYYVNDPLKPSNHPLHLQLLEGSQGQIWSLSKIDGKLYYASDKGLFLVDNVQIGKEILGKGSWKCKQCKTNPQKIYVSTYNGLYVFDKDKPSDIQPIDGYNGSAISFEEDTLGDIWLKKSVNEMVRIRLDNLKNKTIAISKYTVEENNLPKDAQINTIDKQLFFSDNKSYYQLNSLDNKFTLKNPFSGIMEQDKHNVSCVLDEPNRLLLLGNNSLISYNKKTHQEEKFNHSLSLISGFERIVALSDSTFIIPNEDGFALWQSNYRQHNSTPKVEINEISLLGEKDSILYKNNFTEQKIIPLIDYDNNNIRIQYAFDSLKKNDSSLYRYRLNGGKWSEYSSLPFAEYTNLGYDNYCFQVEGSLNGEITQSAEITFNILPPWYHTFWGYLGLILLSLLIIMLLYLIDDKRLMRKTKIMEAEKEKALKEKEETFKKEYLEHELKHKSQELANIAINLVQKNEAMIAIKEDLSKIILDLEKYEKSNPLKRQILLLNNKIDQNINQENGFKIFQEHFDLVHNDFILRLSETYPSLSMHERKMCAFVRIHLSSKEIAPMLNISARGVETLRYRVRKKLNLTREDSLTNFLEHF